MSPFRVSSEAPVFISTSEQDIMQKTAVSKSFEVHGVLFVLPVGHPEDHIVKADGFPLSPGGLLESERLTPGHTKDEILLTTPDDPDLSGEIGASAICIDGVLYEAINP